MTDARDPSRDPALGSLEKPLEKALDQALSLDTPHTPGPGFDTRFFARLDEERTKQRRLRVWRWTWALVPIAAGVALMVMGRQKPPEQDPMGAALQLSPDEVDLAIDLELIEELPVVERLDELEDFELLADLDDEELAKLAAEAE